MKKSLLGLIVLFIFLTTYTPKSNLILNSSLNIQKIKVENNLTIKIDSIQNWKNGRFTKVTGDEEEFIPLPD